MILEGQGNDAAVVDYGVNPGVCGASLQVASGALLAEELAVNDAAADSSLTLWYRKPATQFEEATPIGNGRLGAMIYGGLEQERLSLNEDTLWAGSPYDPVNPEAREALPEVRRLIFAGQYAEAQDLV